MPKLSKEEKKALLKNWKQKQRPTYILNKNEAEKLLDYLDEIAKIQKVYKR